MMRGETNVYSLLGEFKGEKASEIPKTTDLIRFWKRWKGEDFASFFGIHDYWPNYVDGDGGTETNSKEKTRPRKAYDKDKRDNTPGRYGNTRKARFAGYNGKGKGPGSSRSKSKSSKRSNSSSRKSQSRDPPPQREVQSLGDKRPSWRQ